MQLPEPNYVYLNASAHKACAAANIQCVPAFLEKIQQIYEMMLVRHGFMIVGYSFSGKTTAYRMLADALEICEENVNVPNTLSVTSVPTHQKMIAVYND